MQLLRSKILATGLFAHNLTLEVGGHHAWAIDQVRVGNRFATVRGMPFGHEVKATPAQMRALAWIENLVADPEKWLPANVWADRQIRAFVPACYSISSGAIPIPRSSYLRSAKHSLGNSDATSVT